MKKALYVILAIILIVIAALLSTIGYSAYKQNIARTQFAKLAPAIQVLVEMAIRYSKVMGVFPDAYQLNLSSTFGESYITDPAALNQYFGGVALLDFDRDSLNLSDISDPVPCGAMGVIGASLDVELLGFPRSFADNTANNGFECYYWHYEGAFYTQCFYAFGTSKVSQTGDIIPGWINLNTTSDWDFNNDVYTYSQNGYLSPTCQ